MTDVMRPADGSRGGERPDDGERPAATALDSPREGQEASVQGARPRRSAAAPRTIAILLGVVLLGLAVVAGQEAVATSGTVDGLRPKDGGVTIAAQGVDGAALGPTALLAGAIALVLGILLLWAAWHRGPRYARLRPAPALVLRPEDLARLASSAAEDVDGVLDASSTASARQVIVRVISTGSEDVQGEVEQVVGRRLALLENPPSVRVRARSQGAS